MQGAWDLLLYRQLPEAVMTDGATVGQDDHGGVSARSASGRWRPASCARLRSCREPGELRRKVGSQLQESALPDRIKVSEALAFFSSLSSSGAPWETVMEQWGLAEKRSATFGSLSGGQQQRLFVALDTPGALAATHAGGPQVTFSIERNGEVDLILTYDIKAPDSLLAVAGAFVFLPMVVGSEGVVEGGAGATVVRGPGSAGAGAAVVGGTAVVGGGRVRRDGGRPSRAASVGDGHVAPVAAARFQSRPGIPPGNRC